MCMPHPPSARGLDIAEHRKVVGIVEDGDPYGVVLQPNRDRDITVGVPDRIGHELRREERNVGVLVAHRPGAEASRRRIRERAPGRSWTPDYAGLTLYRIRIHADLRGSTDVSHQACPYPEPAKRVRSGDRVVTKRRTDREARDVEDTLGVGRNVAQTRPSAWRDRASS